MTTNDLPLDYAADACDGNFRGGTKTEFVSERQFLRGTETTTTQEDDFSSFEPGTVNGTLTVVDDDLPLDYVLPILMLFFFVFLIFCCLLKNQHQTRTAGSTRNEQEQREIQQRQLPVMASMRRRERELHRIRLETNVRLEKIKGRLAEETNARRILLFEKFKKAGLEKMLTEDDFVPSLVERDKTVRSYETGDSVTMGETNDRHNAVDAYNVSAIVNNKELDPSNPETQKKHDRFQEGDPENKDNEDPVSNLHINWDRRNGEKPSIFPNECAICLQEYRPNEVIAVSDNPSCLHCYHRDCIVEYLIPLLEFEGNNQSNNNGSNHGDETSTQPSQSTATSHGGKGFPCPCCRLPFLVDPPKIEEGTFPTSSSQ